MDVHREDIDISIDTDEVLNVEEEYYQKGFREGQEQSTRQQEMEGKEYGYQTGFQRFLIVGYIDGLVEHWSRNIQTYEASASVANHLKQLEALIKDIPITNGDEEVAHYEKSVAKARNKLRVIATLVKETSKIAKLDELIKEVGGQLQVSENVDDMW
ncbi:predicted protein [Scheffersomyces stipitis CBS 6054]|uniref:Essential protein Yae1 N-terminal domain-containing protein n=1 Tax=Scheffersomyces stipitis (strain ATCC 58785 / CBS 6054 / NBRC 10063 / NRRL Y-11545) TaxID=322104 RepID=A3LPB6_PICST|nr:predicted protein [Scheffersomyces stipitis CBS 6054]ABN65012.2 predicted protein [Scheffersomyces stipitis CBS 6054]KAG2736647.1 hypothetical protein G9P44_000737 [Scheffersomyces stipitis]